MSLPAPTDSPVTTIGEHAVRAAEAAAARWVESRNKGWSMTVGSVVAYTLAGVPAALRAVGIDPDTPLPAPRDTGPHSRACGFREHAHGSSCHSNCPTCHGRDPQAEVTP